MYSSKTHTVSCIDCRLGTFQMSKISGILLKTLILLKCFAGWCFIYYYSSMSHHVWDYFLSLLTKDKGLYYPVVWGLSNMFKRR